MTLASVESSIECILAQTCDSPENITTSFLDEPDLTFGTDNDISGPCSLRTPLTSTPSLENNRKTKSVHISSASLVASDLSVSPVDPPLLGRTAILQRRVRTKAYSVSSLSPSQSKDETSMPDRKRHAIYADAEMSFTLPTATSRTSSVMSVFDEYSPSRKHPFATPPRSSTSKKIPWHLYTKSEAFPRPQVSTVGLSRPPSTPKRMKSVSTLQSLPEAYCSSVAPLRIKKKLAGTTNAIFVPESSPAEPKMLIYHPIVLELLGELDIAIHEWQTCNMHTPL